MTEEVLLLDDDPAMLRLLEGILGGAGFTCRTALAPTDALALIAAEDSHILTVVSDLVMPEVNGLQFMDRLNDLPMERPTPRVLLLTAHPSLEAAVDALRLGCRDFLVKPIRPPELVEAVGRAMTQARQDRLVHARRPVEVEVLMRQAEALAVRLRSLAYQGLAPGTPPVESARTSGPASEMQVDALLGVVHQPPAGRSKAAAPGAPVPGDEAPSLDILATIEQLRRLRHCYEEHALDDVGWDLLLELLRAERMRQRLSVSGLAISISNVSPTTSLRRINELSSRGYIARVPDSADARRDFVSLTTKSRELLADYLVNANVQLKNLAVPQEQQRRA